MAYDYIKRQYGVDLKIGQRITYYGKPAQIVRPVGDPQNPRVRFDGRKHADNLHPTDEGRLHASVCHLNPGPLRGRRVTADCSASGYAAQPGFASPPAAETDASYEAFSETTKMPRR